MVVPLQEFVFVIAGSVVLSLVIVAMLLPWAREVRRLVLIGVRLESPCDHHQEVRE